jgi:hypothetical protein
MKATLTLRRPAHWQDFETLCKKLWGEIWNCPTIRKNGRSGNKQHGVDVYGIPAGEMQYYGIQCKGKDEYTNKQYSESEITEEIENAKKFSPPLKAFYLTTTAVKNADIEQYVREKNIENVKIGLFSIEIFSWEDIVELIDENKATHDWYVNSQNYKTQQSISLTFQDGSSEITCRPLFTKRIIHYKQKKVGSESLFNNTIIGAISHPKSTFGRLEVMPNPNFSSKTNHSYSEIKLRIKNTGKDSIEDFKVILEFQGEIAILDDTNKEGLFANISRYVPNVKLCTEHLAGEIIPEKNVLVSEDVFISDSIFIKPRPLESKIVINWKLLSKDFKDEGQLFVNIQPDYIPINQTEWVEEKSEIRTEEGIIEDYIVEDK